jgi:hypothetical protein
MVIWFAMMIGGGEVKKGGRRAAWVLGDGVMDIQPGRDELPSKGERPAARPLRVSFVWRPCQA